jgi:hypothetical protein
LVERVKSGNFTFIDERHRWQKLLLATHTHQYTRGTFATLKIISRQIEKVRERFCHVAFCITLGKKLLCTHVFQLLMEKADVLRDIKIIGGQIIKSERDESVIITAR